MSRLPILVLAKIELIICRFARLPLKVARSISNYNIANIQKLGPNQLLTERSLMKKAISRIHGIHCSVWWSSKLSADILSVAAICWVQKEHGFWIYWDWRELGSNQKQFQNAKLWMGTMKSLCLLAATHTDRYTFKIRALKHSEFRHTQCASYLSEHKLWTALPPLLNREL